MNGVNFPHTDLWPSLLERGQKAGLGLATLLRTLHAMWTGERREVDARLDCAFLDQLEAVCPAVRGIAESLFYDACAAEEGADDGLGAGHVQPLTTETSAPRAGSIVEPMTLGTCAVVPHAQR